MSPKPNFTNISKAAVNEGPALHGTAGLAMPDRSIHKSEKKETLVKTQGRKDKKLPRINLFLSEDIHLWLQSESIKRGQHMVDLVNDALHWYMQSNHIGSTISESDQERPWHVNFGLQPDIYAWVKPAAIYKKVPLSVFVNHILRSYMDSPVGKIVTADWQIDKKI